MMYGDWHSLCLPSSYQIRKHRTKQNIRRVHSKPEKTLEQTTIMFQVSQRMFLLTFNLDKVICMHG